MGKGKLAKFADMAQNPLVVERPFWKLQQEGLALKGRWHEDFFKNEQGFILDQLGISDYDSADEETDDEEDED